MDDEILGQEDMSQLSLEAGDKSYEDGHEGESLYEKSPREAICTCFNRSVATSSRSFPTIPINFSTRFG
jgi:hypothetical protein